MRYERKTSWKKADVVSDFDPWLRQSDSAWNAFASASFRSKKRDRRLPGACAVHGDLRSMRDRTCCSGYRFLLVRLRPGCHFGSDSDRRAWRRDLCRLYLHRVRQKDLSFAAKCAAGQLFRTPDRGRCETDALYSPHGADRGNGRSLDHAAFLLWEIRHFRDLAGGVSFSLRLLQRRL